MSDVRLIERWLPIAELGEESVRERRALSALPAPYYLHVWWARRPLIASRAAVLASLLPQSTTNKDFLKLIRIDGDPLSARRKIKQAKRTGVRVSDPYGYKRAFYCQPPLEAIEEALSGKRLRILDPTAGGGSIPIEATRLGMETFANDLNSVAATVLTATVDYPFRYGAPLIEGFSKLSAEFVSMVSSRLESFFPQSQDTREVVTSYIWARGATCPYCSGEVPIAPNWKLEKSGAGIRMTFALGTGPGGDNRKCEFEIVDSADKQSSGTVAGANVVCPFPDCERVFSLDEVKQQGSDKGLSEILTAVVVKKRVLKPSKAGHKAGTWERGYRAPTPTDDVSPRVKAKLSEKIREWEAMGIMPTEPLPAETESWTHGNTPHQYGATRFTDLFSRRQLFVHCTSVEVFQEILRNKEVDGVLSPIMRAAFVYLALSIDKLVDWNSMQCTWDLEKLRLAHTFQVHAFPIRWSFAEMDVLAPGLGYHWIIKQTVRCLKELISLGPPDAGTLFGDKRRGTKAVEVSLKSADALDHIETGSVDAIVMDPPYGANVMYAELSDFFYVWLKRTAGLVVPELFTRMLTAKDTEAVSNKAKFKESDGASVLAIRDYRERMQSIFLECRRVMRSNGIMTVMFTHKDVGAWDALTTGLIEAGFIITASWPVNTEAESSTHIKNKAAANSTIFLVCRPRPADKGDETTYWEDVEPLVAKAVRTRVEEFQKAGIGGVDLYLASFGPALEEFSRHWPLKRGTPRPEPLAKKRRKQAELFAEAFDPYAVTPEDALDAARREVKTWRLNQLTHTKGRGDLDPVTSWFVLAWDAFKAPVFSYDEGLRLARAVGADLEGQLIGKLCEKKNSDIRLWDSATRAAKSGLGPADGSRAMIDAIHHAAHRGRTRTLDAARDLLKDAGVDNDPQFLAALEAVLEVLPPSRNFLGFDVATGEAKSASDDFDALEKLRRLAFSDRVDEPRQLTLFLEGAA